MLDMSPESNLIGHCLFCFRYGKFTATIDSELDQRVPVKRMRETRWMYVCVCANAANDDGSLE
jgi:hypothetical protein